MKQTFKDNWKITRTTNVNFLDANFSVLLFDEFLQLLATNTHLRLNLYSNEVLRQLFLESIQ
jgi:hypothetical protein